MHPSLSDPPCKDGNARFTTEPLKAESDQKVTTTFAGKPCKSKQFFKSKNRKFSLKYFFGH